MSNNEFHQRRLSATPRGVGVMCNFFAQSAQNATLTDVEGNEYIDFAAGIAVLNTGHRHPRMVAAVEQQLQQFTHTAYQIVPYESYVSLAEKLNELAPVKGPAKTAFFSTGAEAVENAVKIARAHTGRPGVIAFGGGFHGRTYMTMALTGKVAPYKLGFGPFPGSVYHVPYPSALHGISTADSITALERLFKADIEAKQVAAIIFEPVQGEGGFNVAPKELVAAVRRICDEHGIVMIADEVQSGFARTGKLFAMDHYADKPDLMTMAKSLAGGMPLSGVVGNAQIMDAPAPGGLGGTYAGNPLAVAAAHAVLDIIDNEALCERAQFLGERLLATLQEVKGWCPALVEARGVGSMIAAEFFDPATGEPSAAIAQKIQQQALEQGLLLLTCGQYGNVIRFLYPLTIPDAQFSRALTILQSVTRL
ncbi:MULTISPECIES: 4-aminobutyrate transaminase [Klebsiella]|jgi:4-aminobutyrate aminotransferase|uniref:4-aminobutyrate transaminase n=6 Tax=Klebsiella TaxID=570 RepID=A0AAP9QT22_KLEAE|nr:4-aminobutyrate transaminase [Klebsiella aerogenes]AEG98093.1 4-aminobutyrate transaminase [Klebsiella aerogenes KCTC 2190]ATX87222.1 4-aminobutyrate transaminase [Klebsiella aerogenes]EIV2085950.1 4-aminobutyrate transaminase [Klebsiella aerogenes]EIV2479590.1 4-aminobutyrate transaminase [Klebsiella aerogenes]EIW8577442.1 4-aminobutyrate transaminase [Klebsiella aerogenes]